MLSLISKERKPSMQTHDWDFSLNATEVQLLTHLFQKPKEGSEKLYLYRIAKEMGTRALSTVSENLRRLEEKFLVESVAVRIPKRGRTPVRYYTLTPFGRALAEVLLKYKRATLSGKTI